MIDIDGATGNNELTRVNILVLLNCIRLAIAIVTGIDY